MPANPPFDRLTPKEIETLRAALDIAYFRPGETIIEQDTRCRCPLRRHQGHGRGAATATNCWPCSAPRTASIAALWSMAGAGTHFVAREETLCYARSRSARCSASSSPIRGLRRSSTSRYRASSTNGRDEEEQRYRLADARARSPNCSCSPPLHRRGRHHRSRRPPHARDRQQRPVRSRRRTDRHHHRHEPVQGGGAATPVDRDASARTRALRRGHARGRTISYPPRLCS